MLHNVNILLVLSVIMACPIVSIADQELTAGCTAGNQKKYGQEVKNLLQNSGQLEQRYHEEALLFKQKATTIIKQEADKQSQNAENTKATAFSNKNINPELNKYVFISLSMPQASIKELVTQAKEQGAIPVLRGFKQGSYKQTLEALTGIFKATGYGAIIDPELFKEFDIDTVPTFVLAAPARTCPPETSCKRKFNKISGNISLSYALGKMIKDGEEL